MNRIETKIIIAVTNRLAAARDSQAKTEMIEELSENLYQHYLDLVAAGTEEETAYEQAMETLGDVNELLRYLEEMDAQEGPDGAKTAGGAGKDGEDGWTVDWTDDQESRSQSGGGHRSYTFTFNADDWEDTINGAVNAALSGAKEAMDYAKEAMDSAKNAAKGAAREVSEQMKDKYPDGAFAGFASGRYQQVDCASIASEGVHSLEVKLTNGDIHLCFAEDVNAPVEITGDTKEIQTALRSDGVICVRQGNTASSSFLFHRGMRASNIEIRIPRRCFTGITLITVNGDIDIDDGLSCRTLKIQTVSGDLEAGQLCADKMNVQSVSGDIHITDRKQFAYAETAQEQPFSKINSCTLNSVSGDITFAGGSAEVVCGSVSGDLKLAPLGELARLKASSKSGDVRLELDGDRGFYLSYQTVSGSFSSQLPLAGAMEKRKGRISYLNGGDCEIQVVSTSGDIEIRKR